MSTSMASALLVALQEGPDPEDVKPGWLGLLMFLALAAAVVVLCLSFRKQLRRIDFEEEPDRDVVADEAATSETRSPTQPPSQS